MPSAKGIKGDVWTDTAFVRQPQARHLNFEHFRGGGARLTRDRNQTIPSPIEPPPTYDVIDIATSTATCASPTPNRRAIDHLRRPLARGSTTLDSAATGKLQPALRLYR